jgi:hypothetical protein
MRNDPIPHSANNQEQDKYQHVYTDTLISKSLFNSW